MKTPGIFIAFLFVTAITFPAQAAERPGRKWTTIQRMERPHLEAVRKARERWAEERANPPQGSRRADTGIYNDYRAVMHIHAEDSGHTGGMRPEVLVAAKETGVDVVMFTDHRGPKPDTWRGMRDGVLFFAGSEEDDVLRFPIFNAEGKIEREDLRFLCHVEERLEAVTDGMAGMEIYNRHTDAKDDREFEKAFKWLIDDKAKWAAFAALYKEFPDEIFGAGTDYWTEIIAKWDSETLKKHFTGIGANDAHQNQVFNGLMLDPYEVSFRNLSTHILARELSEEAIRQSLKEGHAYVSHDWLCDPKGFGFVAANNLGVFNMGDPVTVIGTTKLHVQTPVAAKVKLFHNGALKEEQTGTLLTFETKTPGAYRAEAWLAVDGEERPWIYSNPIYLKEPDAFTLLQLPSMETRPNVEIAKDIPYTAAAGEPKQKLDIYKPRDAQNAPVFVFYHGGAWTSGDRSQYPPLGNRYASEGIVTVIPSYRLAPKNSFPAQAEDAAAALKWTVENIARHGGDTNRIYVGGHSAGGHLAALLAANPKHLRAHGLSPSVIKGAIGLSGVYDMTEGKDNVFGTEPGLRKEASPLFHITEKTPPFLLTYCEWDYYPLAPQAKQFHAALKQANIAADLIFIPKESHISEMLAVTRDNDLTAKSVIAFIKKH